MAWQKLTQKFSTIHTLFVWLFITFIYQQYVIADEFPTTGLFYFIMVPLLLVYCFAADAKELKVIAWHPLTKAYVILFAYIIFHGIFLTVDQTHLTKTIRNTLATAGFTWATILFVRFSSPRILKNMVIGLGMLVGLCALYSIIRYYIEHPVDPRLVPMGRAQTQVMAAFIYAIGGMAAMFAYTLANNSVQRFALLCSAVVIGFMLILTQSRMSVAVYIFSAIASALFYLKPSRTMLFKWIGGLILIAFAVDFTFFNAISTYLHTVMARGDSFRFELWEITLANIMIHPWVGSGLHAKIDHFFTHSPHNIYLAAAFTLGLPGFALLIYATWKTCREAWIILKNTHSEWIFFCMMLLANGLISGLIDHSRLVKGPSSLWLIFWFPIGFTIGMLVREALPVSRHDIPKTSAPTTQVTAR